MAHLMRGMAAGGGIRVVAADTSNLVADAASRHGTSATATAALGRTLTAAALLSHVLLKDHRDRVTVRLYGGGPLGGVIAEAGLSGDVRGYVANPDAEPSPRADGKLDVGSAVGSQGRIEVIRSHAPYGDPFSSSVGLVSGEVAEDVAAFLAQSEQIASAVLLGVYVGPEGVETAGGVLLQALPDAEDAALDLLEANVRSFGQLTDGLRRSGLLGAMHELTWGLEMQQITDAALPLRFACRCSDERALEALAYFPPADRDQMIAEDGGAESICHWCGERRWFGPEAIDSLGRGSGEVRCPDCATLWYRDAGTVMVRDGELCACGRQVRLPS